jgi:amino acid adenylation domain-containing protein
MPSAPSSLGRASLVAYLEASATRFPSKTAVVSSGGERLSYAELHEQSSRLAGFFAAQGIGNGDRVGILMPKSAVAIAAMFGTLKAGAAYIPIDREAPPERIGTILKDSGLRALIAAAGDLGALSGQLAQALPDVVVVSGHSDDAPHAASATTWRDVQLQPPLDGHVAAAAGDDLAYILYTSGSTGVPKGVAISHRNATSFVDWCSDTFNPDEHDRFSSHAPFHFDLSVFDVFVSMKHGGTLCLIPEAIGKSPRELARFIAENGLTIWYSTPSTLNLLAEFGDLERHDCGSLRLVLFAGEVFPVKQLRRLVDRWPAPQYFNLYGPTETNVCTWAQVATPIPASRTTPYPIGHPCSHCASLVLDENGSPVREGDEGLLYISGPSVFTGYWNRPRENAGAFLERDGRRWYNTGDVVRWMPGEGFLYLGRRDRMVKRHGYRVELGEIESCLDRHPAIRETAAVAVADSEAGMKIVAFFAANTNQVPGMIELKTFCAQHLPPYMNPDRFLVLDVLPRSSRGKVDYQALGRLASGRQPS